MSRLEEIRLLAKQLRDLAKEEWGNANYECDCEHEPPKSACECFMCTKGWELTELREIHDWEKALLPIITERDR